MKFDVIERFKEEKYEYEKGVVEFSADTIELSLRENEKITGEIVVTAHSAAHFEGSVYSSHYRMESVNKDFAENRFVLSYLFDSKGMDKGDFIKGEFCIVSNLGQFYIPYSVKVEKVKKITSMGQIKNLFHFANLAKISWEEAVGFFYSKEFKHLLVGNDAHYLPAYKGLSVYQGNGQCVEEFLLLIRKKQPIEYCLQETEKYIEVTDVEWNGQVVIEKNGWGYVKIEVETEGDFWEIPKQSISEEDFLGNQCALSYTIKKERLHGGKNYGKIFCKVNHIVLEYGVIAHNNVTEQADRRYQQNPMDVMTIQLMHGYLKYRAKRTSVKAWLQESDTIIERMTILDKNNISARLYQAQILVEKERFNEAKWILNHVDHMIQNENHTEEERCYFLYLKARCERNEEITKYVLGELKESLGQRPESFRILLLVLYLDKKYEEDTSQKYIQLEAIFKKGAFSPIIYLEASRILEENPSYINKLSKFELQVLNFSVKYKLITEGMANQIVYLANKQKEFSHLLFTILVYCYDQFEKDDCLKAMCTLLIKGGQNGIEYHEWFHQAVEKEMRITRLYEYYMMSLDIRSETVLPKMVLMYFSFHSDLDYVRNAYLYAYIHKNRAKWKELYQSYEKQIEKFLLQQIKLKHINENLSYLYKEIIREDMITNEIAEAFAELLFRNQIVIEDETIRYVIVIHEQLVSEQRYPVYDKKAYVSIYARDHCILLEDKEQNRYVVTISYQKKRFLENQRIADMLRGHVRSHSGYLIYACEENREYRDMSFEQLKYYRNVLEEPSIRPYYKKNIEHLLIQYYYEEDYMESLDGCLHSNLVEYRNKTERSELIQYMIIRQMYEEVYKLLITYGFEEISPKNLAKVCDYKISQESEEERYALLQLCAYTFFRGKHSKSMLQFLELYYEGPVKQMRRIWEALQSFDMDAVHICERILMQSLFCESFLAKKEEIFASYRDSKGAKKNLINAYLSKNAYDYFVPQQIVNNVLFEEIFRAYKEQREISRICMMAYVKHMSLRKQSKQPISEEEKELTCIFIKSLLAKRIFFPYFLAFSHWVAHLQPSEDKTFIEYKSKPGTQVILHYMIEKNGMFICEYMREEMKEIYEGIYLKDFILFYGERLQYYITEIKDGNESLVRSDVIEKSDVYDMQNETRFALLNHIEVSCTLQDKRTALQLMEEYEKKVYQAEQIFQLK